MALDPNHLIKPVRKLRKLVGRFRRQPAPEEVHKLRTAARHFEAVNDTLPSSERGGKTLMKDVRRCRKCAGKVRDMDVLTNFASRVHPAGEEECAVQLLEYLGAKRQKYAKRLYSEVRQRRSGMRRDLKNTEAVITKRVQPNGEGPEKKAVARGAAAIARSIASKLAKPNHFTRGNLHPYRLKVKKLRDVLCMASGDTPLTDDLAKVKDAIGQWHDWEELVSIAQKKLAHGSRCGMLARLENISRSKFDHAVAVAQKMRRKYIVGPHLSKMQMSPPLAGAISRLT